jgi:ferredoxin-NADP reductase
MTTDAPVAVPLSPLKRLRSGAARLAEMVATPLVPSDFLDLVDPLRSTAVLRARIISITPETADAATVVLKPGRGWTGHVAGQYLRIGVDVDGVRQWRSYSLTGPERTDGLVSITVKAIPGGLVSNHLVRDAQAGTVVHLDQAAGEFVLPDARPAKALFVTAGSGITPVMGMLRSAGLDGSQDVVLVHSAPTADDVIFAAELRALAAEDKLRLVELHTDTAGMLTTEQLTELVPDLAEREAWACGPGPMLDALEAHWDALGLTLRTERFRPALLVAGEGGTVTYSRTGSVVDVPSGTSLLDAGEAAGVLMPSGCRMGVCFGCVVPLREGIVRDLRNGAVTTAAVGDGVLIQTCINTAAGPCDLEL